MEFTQRSALLLVSFFLLISLAGNVYSFTSKDTQAVNQSPSDESQLLEKEKEIASLQEELEAAAVAAPVENKEVQEATTSEKTKDNEMVNSANRFIEYAFESDSDSYATRKKMALNYMTESLYDTLYASDGVDEEAQKIAVNVKEATVFPDSQGEMEAIVFYVYEEEILSSGYEEQKEMYVKLSFVMEDQQLKVAEIEPLENEYGGI